MGEFVEVLKTADTAQSHILKSKLEAAGIEVHLLGETLNTVFGSLVPSVSSMSVLVPEKDYDKAMEIIHSVE